MFDRRFSESRFVIFFVLSSTFACFSSLKGDWFGICNETSGEVGFLRKAVAVDGHPPS